MQIDLAERGAEDGLRQHFGSQVCVVGGGIGGLILAHRLVERGIRVTLLEAGGSEQPFAPDSDPFGAELKGRPHAGTRVGRICALGGCSLTWGGQLLPLPEDAGWAVSGEALQAYQADAEALLGVDQLPYAAEAFFAAMGNVSLPRLAKLPEFTPRFAKFIPFGSRNLARTLGPALAAHPHAMVVLHAVVTELVLRADGERVDAVCLQTGGDRPLRLEAEQFVVAAGTVESCRLLLASRSVARAGVGNACGQVGRNFHDHLTVSAVTFQGQSRERMLAQLRPWVVPVAGRGPTVHSLKLEPSAALRAELGLPAAMAHLVFEEPEGSGLAALRGLLRRQQGSGASGVVWRVLVRSPRAIWEGLRLLWAAHVRRRRYVSRAAAVRLQLNLAQMTPSNANVGLAEGLGSAALPKAVVSWEVCAAELEALRRFADWLRERLEAMGLAEGAVWSPVLLARGADADAQLLAEIDDARHAMGGACMGTDPRTSVVDAELRVHGVRNLSMASAAVFPDGSAQLPTLTLAALCLRLADRLAQELGRG